MQKTEQRRLMPARHVVSAAHGDRTVLLDMRSGHYFGLDEVATRIWHLTQDGIPVSGIVGQLAHEYEVPTEALQADVEAFVKRLGQKHLLEDA